jgi:hypothetical protein
MYAGMRVYSVCGDENQPAHTLRAYAHALLSPVVDGIIAPVHRTADGRLVVIGDPMLGRTTNGLSYPVLERTLRQVRKLRAGPRDVPCKVPRIEELFDLVTAFGERRGAPVSLDIMLCGAGTGVIVGECLASLPQPKTAQVTVSTAYAVEMMDCRERFVHGSYIGILVSQDGGRWSDGESLSAIRIPVSRADPRFVASQHELGRKVIVSNVNGRYDAEYCAGIFADAISTRHLRALR